VEPPVQPSAEPPTRRRPSAAPAEILKATQALLLETGIDGVSIRRVSERCGYSAPTIYHHFGDKRGLIDALLEERFRVVYELMAGIPGDGEPARHLSEMARAFVRFAVDNPSHYQLLMAPGLANVEAVPSAEAARVLARAALEKLAAQGSLATPDIDAAFQVLWAMLHGVISLYLAAPEREVAAHLDELAFDVIEHGLLRRHVGSR
jgi:AcrR family transcriptional regulator